MALLSEVDAFCNLVIKARSLVQYAADGWFKGSQDVTDFADQVKQLSDNQKVWSDRLERFGMTEHPVVKAAMDNTQRLLDLQESELHRLQSKCCPRLRRKCCPRLRRTFPTELTTQMSNLMSCIENVENILEEDQRHNVLAGNARLNEVRKLPFTADNKYVPLEGSVKAVREALESGTASRFVTLYGASGLGKSSMARHVALLYEGGANIPVPRSGQTPIVPTQTFFKHGVFFLRCGPNAVYSSLLQQLWEMLGFERLGPTSIDSSNLTQQSLPSSASGTRLKEQLFSLLKDQKILIILDDVRETTLVENLLIDREGIKYLITAHHSRIWPDGEQIRLERPSLEEARKIVASHVHVKGFLGKVSDDLQDIVDEIIEKCNHDPFDLANVAAKIRRNYAHEPGEWESIAANLQDARDGDPYQPVGIYGRTYSKKTKANALELRVSAFRPEVLTVLFMAAICETEYWIPDVVFKIFFKRAHSSLALFWGCKEELASSDIVKVDRKMVRWSNVRQETLSIHERYREFVDASRKDEVEIMVRKLLKERSMSDDDGPSTILVCVLLVLYGQKAWRDEAARRLNISIDEKNLPRAVEPFVWLLCAGGDEEWQKLSHQHATEVIFQYLKSGKLDDHGMSKLLMLPQTTMKSCEALHTMARLVKLDKSESLLTVCHVDTVKALLSILRNEVDSTKKGVAMNALNKLAFNYAYATDSRGESIVPLVLAQPQDWFLTLLKTKSRAWITISMQQNFFSILGALAYRTTNDAILIEKLIPGIREDLVNLIGKDVSSIVQEGALFALSCLYSHDALSSSMVAIPGALNTLLGGLVDFLDKEVSSDLQKQALIALRNMTKGSLENQVLIASFARILERLVELLATEVSSDVQQHVVETLVYFSDPHNNNNIGSFPGVLEGLVKLLARGIDQNLQMQVVTTLVSMTMNSTAFENPIKIALFPGAVEGLVGLVATDVLLELQQCAIWALSPIMSIKPCLFEGNVGLSTENFQTIQGLAHKRQVIATMPSVLDCLVKFLTTSEVPYLKSFHIFHAILFTFVDFDKAENMNLQSRSAYGGRGVAKLNLGMYDAALVDLDICLKDVESESDLDICLKNSEWKIGVRTILRFLFSERALVKAKLQDYNGALEDVDRNIELRPDDPYGWLERGVIKRMMQDLDGALLDLNKSLELGGKYFNASKDYWAFAHRGYIKHVQGDDKGAREDGEKAQSLRSCHSLQPKLVGWQALRCQTMEYLEFDL